MMGTPDRAVTWPRTWAIAAVAMLWLVAAPLQWPSEAVTAASHQPETIRLYGCGDDLGAAGDPARDGHLDCASDALRLEHAWLSGAADPFLRHALGARDQTIALSLQYRPVWWAPAPGQGPGAIADPRDPAAGLFDVQPAAGNGRFDPAFVSDEEVAPDADPDDEPDPVDREAPLDGLADIHERNDGRHAAADLYVPVVSVRYDNVWTAGSDEPARVPDGGSFLFPYASEDGLRAGADAWNLSGEPTPVHWRSRPFGIGTVSDGLIAVHTPLVALSPGDSISLLDHGATFTGFIPQGDGTAALFDVYYAGAAVPERIGTGFALRPGVEGTTDATLSGPGERPRNVLFADATRAVATVPAPGRGAVDDDDDAWFVLVEEIRTDAAGNGAAALVRIGRLLAPGAPLGAYVVDRAVYTVDIDEGVGGLTRFSWTRHVPLGGDFRFRAAGLDIAGSAPGARIPLARPFSEDHVARRDVRPPLLLDDHGFLREAARADGVVGTGELALSPEARTPEGRLHRVGPLAIRWMGAGADDRWSVTVLPGGDPGAALWMRRAPLRYATFALPEGSYHLTSTLFGDSATVSPLPGTPGPRAAAAWLYTPGSGPYHSVDDGLRLYGAPYARPSGADVLIPAAALLRAGDHAGLIRTPRDSVHEEVGVAVRYVPFHVYADLGRGFVGVSDESLAPTADLDHEADPIDAAVDGDNLFDVAPRNDDPTAGDVYGPAVVVEYRFALRRVADLAPSDAPLGPGSFWLLPAADRDPSRPGLDSFDLDGDGDHDPVDLAGFWSQRAGPAPGGRLGSGPGFTPGGAPGSADLLWLRSPELSLAIGRDARLFDVGARFMALDPSTGLVRLSILDLAGADGPTARGVVDVRLSGPRCVTVHYDGSYGQEPVVCDGVQPAAPGIGPRDQDALGWIEVVGAAGDRITLRLHRAVAAVDGPATGDDRAFVAGGVAYRWSAVTAGTGEASALRGLRLEAVVPIGAPMRVPARGGDVGLTGLGASGVLPLVPPFDQAHHAVVDFGVGLERDAHGFVDAASEEDGDAVAGLATERAFPVGPLLIQLERRDQERAHRYVVLDPVRALDRDRSPGIATVGGMFADPADGWRGTPTPVVPRLKTTGTDAFDEALRSPGERGWDHYVTLGVSPDRGRYLVDSARLVGPAATMSIGGKDPAGQWPVVLGRVPGFWLYDPLASKDVYVASGALDRPPDGPEPEPPLPDPPSGPEDPNDPPPRRDSPGAGAGALIVLLVALIGLRRLRQVD